MNPRVQSALGHFIISGGMVEYASTVMDHVIPTYLDSRANSSFVVVICLEL